VKVSQFINWFKSQLSENQQISNQEHEELADFIDQNNTGFISKAEFQFLLELPKFIKVKQGRDMEIPSQLQGLKPEAHEVNSIS
jgi:hypothetical protein